MTAPPRETTARLKEESQKRLHYHHQQLRSAGALTIPWFKHLVAGLSQWRSVDCGILLHRHIHGLTKPKFLYPQGTVSGCFLSQAEAFADGCTGIQYCITGTVPEGCSQWCRRKSCSAVSVFFTSSPQPVQLLRGCSVRNFSCSSTGIRCFACYLSFTERYTQLGIRKSEGVSSPVPRTRACVQLPDIPGCCFN